MVGGFGFPAVDTRRCTDCQEEKTIRGVWFLVNGTRSADEEDSSFVCEDCYTQRQDSLRGAGLQREPGSGRGAPTG
jgi:hypothetical protein